MPDRPLDAPTTGQGRAFFANLLDWEQHSLIELDMFDDTRPCEDDTRPSPVCDEDTPRLGIVRVYDWE